MKLNLSPLLFAACLMAGCTTPYTTGNTPTGGVADHQVADREYLIRSAVNGFTSPAQIKPQAIRRAKEIGAKNGYAAFQLLNPTITFNISGSQFSTLAKVHFYKEGEPLLDERAQRFLVGDPDSFRPGEVSQRERFARLEGYIAKSPAFTTLWVQPIYFDPVGTSSGGMFDWDSYYLKPGRHRVVAYVYAYGKSGAPPFGFQKELDAELEAGEEYRLNVSLDEGSDVWIENKKTGQRTR